MAQKSYNLWLDIKKIDKQTTQREYSILNDIAYSNEILDSVGVTAINLLKEKLEIILGKPISITNKRTASIQLSLCSKCAVDNEEGFLIENKNSKIIIQSKSTTGILYGVFKLLEITRRKQSLEKLLVKDFPKIKYRILNHWDNLDRTVERGYAGFSIWNWHELPEVLEKRYVDYAIANASLGINGVVLTNVNANALVLRSDYIQKVKTLADLFRKYGIKVYLTARFSAPIELGKLKTADPLSKEVQFWWRDKIAEIYKVIPDFGGFCVKANSEGQPGPQDYNRSHADGANMFASALQPVGGVVMWRAFVYSHDRKEDRTKQAYTEFKPLDGKFQDNVILQVKNGPLDFQPREPIHPLFGQMPKTPLMLELQITKEYLGQGTHLVGLGSMYEEILNTDTYTQGDGSTVAKIIDGSLHNSKITGIAGVSNIGTAINWTGNFFGQADWYAYGRFAWNPHLKVDSIYKDWIDLTFRDNSKQDKKDILAILKLSYEACVNYMTPLGLHHIMAEGHHYGPGPWVDSLFRDDWTAVYYHKADPIGIGYDRTNSGSNLLGQYSNHFSKKYENVDGCPLEYLLWFHRVPWTKKLKTTKSLWEEMIYRYDKGVKDVQKMSNIWDSLKSRIDPEISQTVSAHLTIQNKEAQWWRDACLRYFATVGNLQFPKDVITPPYDLNYYKSLSFPYAPGLRPNW
jgi:alpha-glucuronidase